MTLAKMEPKEPKSLFERCREIDCSDIIHKNYQGVAYISWADAWARLKENFPDAEYQVVGFEGNVPYLKTEFGVFVKVVVRIEGIEMSEMLPVMDNKMSAIREPDARDINDSLKRCLVKAIALHGLGLSVYEKEDVHAEAHPKQPEKPPHSFGKVEAKAALPLKDGEFRFAFGKYKGMSFAEIPPKDLDGYIAWMKKEDEKSGKGAMNKSLYAGYDAFKRAKESLEPNAPPFGDDDLPF